MSFQRDHQIFDFNSWVITYVKLTGRLNKLFRYFNIDSFRSLSKLCTHIALDSVHFFCSVCRSIWIEYYRSKDAMIKSDAIQQVVDI
ncbi:hypothetical protein PM8797T_28614 [Gimesia maris DSM 8797]|nr:hypothetical protein PM8797T_28614 [Gimesia maris DSM 8797]